MINVNEVLHKENALDFSHDLEPICIQFGGSDLDSFSLAAKKAKDLGFKELNINYFNANTISIITPYFF